MKYRILVLLLMIILSILLHEAGHLLMLLFSRIHVYEILFPSFKLVCTDGKLKFEKFERISSITIIPDFLKITSHEDIDEIKNKYCWSLWMGPIITLTIICILLIFYQIVAAQWSKIILITLLFNIMLLINCFTDNENHIGDIIAGKYVKNEKYFLFSYILNWYVEYSSDRNNDSFYFQYTKTIIRDIATSDNLYSYQLTLINDLLKMYLTSDCKSILSETDLDILKSLVKASGNELLIKKWNEI